MISFSPKGPGRLFLKLSLQDTEKTLRIIKATIEKGINYYIDSDEFTDTFVSLLSMSSNATEETLNEINSIFDLVKKNILLTGNQATRESVMEVLPTFCLMSGLEEESIIEQYPDTSFISKASLSIDNLVEEDYDGNLSDLFTEIKESAIEYGTGILCDLEHIDHFRGFKNPLFIAHVEDEKEIETAMRNNGDCFLLDFTKFSEGNLVSEVEFVIDEIAEIEKKISLDRGN